MKPNVLNDERDRDRDSSSLRGDLTPSRITPLVTLSRTPRPYHRRGESLTKVHAYGHSKSSKKGSISTSSTSSSSSSSDAAKATDANGGAYTTSSRLTPSRGSDSSESGTEADDEKGGPFLKSLPAPPLRLRKGLRGSSPADLTPVPSPLPTPPAYVEGENDARDYFEIPRKTGRKTSQTTGVAQQRQDSRDYEAYKKRKRREIVRRCTETSLLCGIGVIVWTSRGGATTLVDWLDEILTFLLIPPCVYLLYPLRLTIRALAAGKTFFQALRLGFHIPSRFDPGPLLYPVALPPMIALSLFHRSSAFLPAAMVCGLSSMPPITTATSRIPAIGEHLHWLLSILPLHASNSSLVPGSSSKPIHLKLGPGSDLTREDLAVLFPLHQALMTVLGYLTTSSLDISELHLLSSALINLLIFARTPQAEILKAMLWLGGLCIFITCKNVLIWEVALARVPMWKLLRMRRPRSLIAKIDHSICALLVRAKYRRLRRDFPYDSDDDDGVLPLKKPLPKPRPRLKPLPNGVTSSQPADEPMSAYEAPLSKTFSFEASPFGHFRRNTFTTFERIVNNKQQSHAQPRRPLNAKRAKTAPTGPSAAFLSFSVEQARVRKYAYAGIAYLFVFATILGPVRLYVSKRALSSYEPFGWALGYLFGNIPFFRFWVISNNLERWIRLPARDMDYGLPFADGLVEYIREYILGPANMHLFICAYCVVVLGVGLLAVLRLTSVVEVDTRRKVFHGIMVAMLLPTIFVDPCFIALALSLILAIFLLLDLFRASQLPPISKPLTTFLAPYVDGRDHRGPVIVSHIFLLIGCAIPLWLSLAAAPRVGEDPWVGWDTSLRDLSMVSGVICVGMGDAAASLIGRRYGKTKWYWAGGKSLEGSLAFAFAVTCGLSAAWVWLRLGGWASWQGESFGLTLKKCLIAGMGASLLESTLTAANDNVVVPVGLWLLVRGLDI